MGVTDTMPRRGKPFEHPCCKARRKVCVSLGRAIEVYPLVDKKNKTGEQCFQGPRFRVAKVGRCLRPGRVGALGVCGNLVDDSIDDAHRRYVRQSAGKAARVGEVGRPLFYAESGLVEK